MDNALDLSGAVNYHYDRFPPSSLDWERILSPLADASAALARYDQMLKGMHDNQLFLTPLRKQEAVISSRMEGTISTIDEVLRLEADQDESDDPSTSSARTETKEVYLYARAMLLAQRSLSEGAPLSKWLIRSTHEMLLSFGRGTDMSPGEFKTEQNYLGDRYRKKIHFIPISAERLEDGLDTLFEFIGQPQPHIHIRTALAHIEFEALHPFKDGNGRIGRMIIPLMLWKFGAISAPYFYVSAFFENHRDEYIDRMRAVSASGAWTDWVLFFLTGLKEQADANLRKTEQIGALYEKMKTEMRELLGSQWTTAALDFLFSRAIFRNNDFTSASGIPKQIAHRFTRQLTENGFLNTLEEASGRRAALYAFEPLLALLRT